MQKQAQNMAYDDDDVLFYSNDNISFNIKEKNAHFNAPYQNIQSPYLKAGSGNMTFEDPNSISRKINYDDILNSFNVQLVNGQLVVKSPDINSVVSPIFKQDPYQNQPYYSNNNNNTRSYQSPRPPQGRPVETKPVRMKNDSFYKYFKSHNLGSYIPENKEQKEEIPEMTPEELMEYRRKKYLEEVAKRQRIQQIKSKNMFFYNGVGENTKIRAQMPNTKDNLNRLFKFSHKL